MLRILAILCLSTVLWASSPDLFYYPTCPDIQPLAPPQEGGVVPLTSAPAIVWNGREYASVWTDNPWDMGFRRFFADGTPAGPVVRPFTDAWIVASDIAMVWNGTGYGIAYVAHDGNTNQAWFARLNEEGGLLPVLPGDPPNPQRVSFVGVSPTTVYVTSINLAWSGTGYAVVWTDDRTAISPDVYCTLLDADGRVGGTGESLHDIPICVAAGFQQDLVIAYSSGGGKYLIAWDDARSGHYQIFSRAITQAGVLDSEGYSVVESFSTWEPTLVASGSRMGLAWLQNQGGVNQVFFKQLYSYGGSASTAVQATNAAVQCMEPFLVWTGIEYGLFYQDNNGLGQLLINYKRISSIGVPVAGQAQVSPFLDLYSQRAAFGRYGFMLTATYGINYMMPLGCQGDNTPPTCSANLLAYNITGNAATFSWLPSTEDSTDIAYYQVYRDNIPLARTANNYYRDTGLDLSTTYNYSVRPINAAQMENGACSESIYLKTNASLVLKMDKSTPDAHLSWTDGGMNNYNIFRGTSPQVMQKIGNTSGQEAMDPEVLLDGVNYFYTVDDPGQ